MNDKSFLCLMQLLTVSIYFTAALLFIYVLLINLYLYWFHKLEIFSSGGTTPATTFSVIIPARNEEENIEACIRSILNNNYPTHFFEIIVADDFSTDATPEIVQQLQTKF